MSCILVYNSAAGSARWSQFRQSRGTGDRASPPWPELTGALGGEPWPSGSLGLRSDHRHRLRRLLAATGKF